MKLTPARREILDAAAECFMEQGFHATSIDVVARRMNATKGRVYHHYQSKVDLFFDVHRLGLEILLSSVHSAAQIKGNALEVLGGMMKSYALALFGNHTYESVCIQGVQLHRFGALTPRQRDELDTIIQKRDEIETQFKKQVAAAQGEKLLAGRDISISVKALLGALNWSLIWYRPDLDSSPEGRDRLATTMVDTLLFGLVARGVVA